MSSRRTKGKKRGGQKTDDFQIDILNCDMHKDMQKKALEIVKKSYIQSHIEKDLACLIKTEFENIYPETTWHCIVGTHFISAITHATDHLMFIKINQHTVLLFKSLD